MAQTAWVHDNGKAKWSFSGTEPASSLWLKQSMSLILGIEYKISILASVKSSFGLGANGYTGNIKVIFSDGLIREDALVIPIDNLVSGVNDEYIISQVNVPYIPTQKSYSQIELFAEITSASGGGSELDILIDSISVNAAVTDGNSKFIGGIRIPKDDVNYLFFYNPDPVKNTIVKFENDTFTNVISWAGLNFSPLKEHRINGGGVAGELLYFTDNYNEPRCIHLTRYSGTIPETVDEINLIKRSPQIPPSYQKNRYGTPNTDLLFVKTGGGIGTITVAGQIPIDTPLNGALYFVNSGNVYPYNSWSGNTFNVARSALAEPNNFYVGGDLNQNLINEYNFQFAYYYEYIDNQISVLSPYSSLCAKSYETEDYRRIRVSVPDNETIPNSVRKIHFVARKGSNGTFYRIGSVDITTSEDRFIDFFNNTIGEAVDPFQLQPESLVPRRCKAMKLAKSRLWLGNLLEGYSNNGDIDMSLSLNVQKNATDQSQFGVYKLSKRVWRWITIPNDNAPPSGFQNPTFEGYYQFDTTYGYWTADPLEDILYNGVYPYVILRDTVFDVVDYNPNTFPQVLNRISPYLNIPVSSYPNPPSAILLGVTPMNQQLITQYGTVFTEYIWEKQVDAYVNFAIPVNELVNKATFPLDSSYKVGILFSDGNGRKSAVVTNKDLTINTPSDNVNQVQINWSVNSDIGIPSWAKYYSIVMSKNLKKSWFIEDYCLGIQYLKYGVNDNELLSSVYNASYPYIKVDVRNLPLSGQGYSFEQGDRIAIRGFTDGSVDLPILSFDGSYIIALIDNAITSGVLNANDQYVYEIYKPNSTLTLDTLFYEIGQVYRIGVDSNTGELRYNVRSGIIRGTARTIEVDRYTVSGEEIVPTGVKSVVKQMVLDENGVWNTDFGRAFIASDSIGESHKESSFRHSGTFIGGTEINYLSDFEAGNEGTIPFDSGGINKLVTVNREASESDVILAISNSDSYSIYIDEARLASNSGSFLIGATKVIGDVRKHSTGFGTIHPESVLEEDGYVYFYDKLARSFLRYASNGIFPISEYKAVRHFEEVSALNAESDMVVTGYDPYYKALFVTFTNAQSAERKTIVYSLNKERWVTYVNFAPEGYIMGSGCMYSIFNGTIYKHDNSGQANFFYGQTYESAITKPFNDGLTSPKEWRNLAIGCSPNLYQFNNGDQRAVPDSVSAVITNPQGQNTNILHDEFDVDENVLYGEIRGDLSVGKPIYDSDPIFSNVIDIKVTMAGGSSIKTITYLRAGFVVSRGHSM